MLKAQVCADIICNSCRGAFSRCDDICQIAKLSGNQAIGCPRHRVQIECPYPPAANSLQQATDICAEPYSTDASTTHEAVLKT